MNNKRGLAAEMAIVAMLTVAALCTVLLVVSRMMQKTATNDYTYIVASAETNQVAEDFVAAFSMKISLRATIRHLTGLLRSTSARPMKMPMFTPCRLRIPPEK